VAGFSQGGAVALLMLRSDLKLAGVAGLSTWLTLANEPLLSAANEATPLWMAHGTADAVVRAHTAHFCLAKGHCHTNDHGDPCDQIKSIPVLSREQLAGCRSQVRYEYGERSAAKLKAAGAHVAFNSYPGMQHEARPDELDAFQKWFTSVLG
jgi:predicted esterase